VCDQLDPAFLSEERTKMLAWLGEAIIQRRTTAALIFRAETPRLVLATANAREFDVSTGRRARGAAAILVLDRLKRNFLTVAEKLLRPFEFSA
jgi:hypothetical protein